MKTLVSLFCLFLISVSVSASCVYNESETILMSEFGDRIVDSIMCGTVANDNITPSGLGSLIFKVFIVMISVYVIIMLWRVVKG